MYFLTHTHLSFPYGHIFQEWKYREIRPGVFDRCSGLDALDFSHRLHTEKGRRKQALFRRVCDGSKNGTFLSDTNTIYAVYDFFVGVNAI